MTQVARQRVSELAKLQAQTTPAFAEMSSHLYVPFRVRPFRHSRVAWLNRRWFAENGVDCSKELKRIKVERWLLDWFGVGVPGADDPDETYGDREQLLYADRYGAPSGSAHGGSGRVGTLGGFNGKGIGRTPLVSVRSDWYHTHGCMFLEEGVREAIVSEVAAAIFPHGAIPTLAVIDTGTRIHWGDGTCGARRAVIVRPAFLRLASLMRSIYFGSSGHIESDQTADAARVRDTWHCAWSGVSQADALSAVFTAIGEQYGHGHVLRLWPGPLFASNVSLDGQLVDFGSFRALPNWTRAQGETRAHAFGNEVLLVADAARALERNARRHGISVDAKALVEYFQHGFRTGCADALTENGIATGSHAANTLESIRARQQRIVADLTGGAAESICIAALRPRTSLYRETLLAETEAMIADLGEGTDVDLRPIASFIDDHIARAV